MYVKVDKIVYVDFCKKNECMGGKINWYFVISLNLLGVVSFFVIVLISSPIICRNHTSSCRW